MARSKWMAGIILFVVSLAGAIALTHRLSPHALKSSYSRSLTTVEETYQAPNLHQNSYVDVDNEQTAAEESFRVGFPAEYREEFMHYVTVNCSNSHIVRQMYVNLSTVEAMKTSDTVPSGTALVMETYATQSGRDDRPPTQLNNVFVREKRDDWRVNDNSGEWRSAWYSPEGSLVSSSQSSCIGCHARVQDRDYLFTLPALLKAAKTNQKQSQETEFGTSVCR